MVMKGPSADELVIAVSGDGHLRARAARTSGVCAEAVRRHRAGPLAAHALARALTCAALYPTSFKDCARLSLQFSGAGPLRSVFAELRAEDEGPGGLQGKLRGYTKMPAATLWAAEPGQRRIGRALAPGSLQVIRQQPSAAGGGAGGFAQGLVELASGEIDEDLEHYFTTSEQVPTRVLTAVELDPEGGVLAAAGILVQALPGAEPSALAEVSLEPLTARADPSALLSRVLPAAVIKESLPLSFACPCSRQRALGGIALLGSDEVIDMIAVGGPDGQPGAEVRCELCAEVYRFTAEDLLPLVEVKGGSA
jgi:molecular chaperone Hsp33